MSQEDDLLDLFDINLSMDDNKTKMATAKEIKEMVAFIGGLSKWTALPEKVKEDVIKLLDYRTRVMLSRCSILDNEIERRVPIQVEHISIDGRTNHYDDVTEESTDAVEVKVTFPQSWKTKESIIMSNFELKFLKKDDGSMDIGWQRYYRNKNPECIRERIENTDYYEGAVKFFESWLKRCNYGVTRLRVTLDSHPTEPEKIKRLKNCNELHISATNEQNVRFWLDLTVHKLDRLSVYITDGLSEDVLSHYQIQNAHSLSLGKADFTDQLLLDLEAKKFSFELTSGVTDQGLNAFLKRWARGAGVDGFIGCNFRKGRDVEKTVLLDGLNFFPWTKEFEDRHYGGEFTRFNGTGDRYQVISDINRYSSATLMFADDHVLFSVSGIAATYNGEMHTQYTIPYIY